MGKKEEEYEVIEGGDDDSEDDIGYSESKGGQKKIDSLDTEEEMEDEDISPQKEKSPEKLRFKDGDDDWDKDQEDVDLDDTEEKKEEAKEEVEEKVEEKKELSKEEKEDEEIKKDMIKYLSEEEGGTKYKIKGKDYDLRDLSRQELRDRFSKAGRFEQRMQEMSVREKAIIERERNAEEVVRNSQSIMEKYGGKPSGETVEVPDAFKPHEDDTDEVRALKETNANLYNRVDKLESDGKQQDFRVQEQDLYRQLESLEKEFPMLSKSEVIAVKSMPEYADADIRVIAENSHNARIGDEYLDAVKKARPEYFRELDDKAVERHLMKNPKVKKVSRKTSSTVASKKISSGKKDAPRTWDEIEARDDEFKRGLDEALEEDE